MKKILATVITCLSITSAYAERTTTSVFCATSDGNHWDWLEVEKTQIKISGEWGRGTNTDGSLFDYFEVSEGSYLLLNQMCKLNFTNNYVAQPSDSFWGEWYVFLINRLDGSQYITDGRYGTTSRHLLPSAFRL